MIKGLQFPSPSLEGTGSQACRRGGRRGKRQQREVNTPLTFMTALLGGKKKTPNVCHLDSPGVMQMYETRESASDDKTLFCKPSPPHPLEQSDIWLTITVRVRGRSSAPVEVQTFAFVSGCHVGLPPGLRSGLKPFHVPTVPRDHPRNLESHDKWPKSSSQHLIKSSYRQVSYASVDFMRWGTR